MSFKKVSSYSAAIKYHPAAALFVNARFAPISYHVQHM